VGPAALEDPGGGGPLAVLRLLDDDAEQAAFEFSFGCSDGLLEGLVVCKFLPDGCRAETDNPSGVIDREAQHDLFADASHVLVGDGAFVDAFAAACGWAFEARFDYHVGIGIGISDHELRVAREVACRGVTTRRLER
jgi:hypothetical protein